MTLKTRINKLLKYLGITVSRPKRVRVHVPIEDAKTGPDSWDLKEGQTHFYNDGCPGGHSDCAPKQPSSDNNVTGPTS